MAATTSPPRPPTPARQKPPPGPGLRWSNVWRGPNGRGLIEGTQEVPVDGDWTITGDLWVCPWVVKEDCPTEVWWFIDGEPPRPRCCPDHPVELVKADIDKSDPALAVNARTRMAGKLRASLDARRQKALDAAAAKVASTRKAVEDAARKTAADMRGHVSSLTATTAALCGGVYLNVTQGMFWVSLYGLTAMTIGTVLTYVTAYPILTWRRTRRTAEPGDQLAARKVRARTRSHARQIAVGVFAWGAWTVLASVTGTDPTTIGGVGALLAGCVTAWAVCRRHWETLWATRRRIRELARLKAESAARRAQEEADRLRQQPERSVVVADDGSPTAVGRRIAADWDRIARGGDVPSGFQMHRSRIIPEDTRAITIPGDDGGLVQIGFEFSGVCEPGALVARAGMQSPLVSAGNWLASMFERDPATMSVIDRPADDDGNPRPNRFLLLLTDRAPLGAGVPWKGRDGVRVTADGTIYVHGGRTLTGKNIDEIMYRPGSPFGGLTVGTTGAGKTGGTILRLLNALAAGIFPILDDPKQLVDYADFCGVFPIGVTTEHSRVIVRSLNAERARRERYMATRAVVDRHGRTRPAEAVWKLSDGPPILAVVEEFHLRASDPLFTGPLTTHVRLQRASGMGVEAVTQAGGLADMRDSVLRGLLAMVRLRLYRTTDASALLAGYKGTYLVSSLPRVPGVCLDVSETAPPVPLRSAYVNRDVNVEDSVFDHLFAPDMTPLLTAPALPAETLEVFRREGLLDLWELGKGPNGLGNLLADGDNGNYYTPATAGQPASGRMEAREVLLAVIATTPGCARDAFAADKPVWTAAGWSPDKPPHLSTFSRSLNKLTGEGLVTYTDGGGYHATQAGTARAAAAVQALFGAPPDGEQDESPEPAADGPNL